MSPSIYAGSRQAYIKAVAAARRDALNELKHRHPKDWHQIYAAAKAVRLREAGLLQEPESDPPTV